MEGIASIDLFVVPTITFERLFAFLILGHCRRQLLWIGVTRNPTAEWLARQITEAFPWDRVPKYLIRDNDRTFGRSRLAYLSCRVISLITGRFFQQITNEVLSHRKTR
jgi:hypothetical protein